MRDDGHFAGDAGIRICASCQDPHFRTPQSFVTIVVKLHDSLSSGNSSIIVSGDNVAKEVILVE